jgi:hypothetical protein
MSINFTKPEISSVSCSELSTFNYIVLNEQFKYESLSCGNSMFLSKLDGTKVVMNRTATTIFQMLSRNEYQKAIELFTMQNKGISDQTIRDSFEYVCTKLSFFGVII